jgi:hypothetical protein
VAAQVDERAAALLLLVGEHAPDGHPAAAHGVGLGGVDLAERTPVDELAQELVLAALAVLEADGELLAGALGGVAHLAGVGAGDGHGLLHQHVLARLQGRAGDLAVVGVPRAHVDDVDGLVRQDPLVVGAGVGVGRAVRGAGLLRPVDLVVAEGDDLGPVLVLGQALQVLAGADEPQTDNADAKLVAHE